MSGLLGIQIIGLLFALLMSYFSFVSYKRKEFKTSEFVFWITIWVVFIAVTLFPGFLDPVIAGLNIARKMDLFTIAGFMFLIGLVFYSYMQTRRNKRKIESVVRKIALERK